MDRQFNAVMLVPNGEASVEVGDFNGAMAVYAPEGPILITREQAIEFFRLEEVKA